MRELVTLQQARDQLRSDTTDDDTDLRLKIAAASELVIDYLKDKAQAFLNEDGTVPTDEHGAPQGIPARVQMATLLTVGFLYQERTGSHSNQDAAAPSALPKAAQAVLASLRTPTIA